jgi:hypothetical protein
MGNGLIKNFISANLPFMNTAVEISVKHAGAVWARKINQALKPGGVPRTAADSLGITAKLQAMWGIAAGHAATRFVTIHELILLLPKELMAETLSDHSLTAEQVAQILARQKYKAAGA